MRVAHPLLLVLAFASGASAQTPASAPALDFEFFKTRVQPIFLAERPGHAAALPVTVRDAATPAAAGAGRRPGPKRSRARTSRPFGGWSYREAQRAGC